eukprot:514320-Pelagomonas_calceolata.AAC.2
MSLEERGKDPIRVPIWRQGFKKPDVTNIYRNLTQNYGTKSPMMCTPLIHETKPNNPQFTHHLTLDHTALTLVLHLPLSSQKFTNHAWPALTTNRVNVGMITLSRSKLLHKAFYRAKLAGVHETLSPAPTSLASEVQGLLARKTMLGNKYASKKIKDSLSRALPTHINPALYCPPRMGLGKSRKNGLSTDHKPRYQNQWSTAPRHSPWCLP